jgi:hypothetical protein
MSDPNKTARLNETEQSRMPSNTNDGMQSGVGARSSSVLKEGDRIDGWASLVDGMADKAPQVIEEFQRRIAARNLPRVRSEPTDLKESGVMGEQRRFQMIRYRDGYTLAVYIDRFGNDLYLAYDLWGRRVIRWATVFLILGIAFVLSFLSILSDGIFFELFNWGKWIAFTMGFIVLGTVGGVALGAFEDEEKGTSSRDFIRSPKMLGFVSIAAILAFIFVLMADDFLVWFNWIGMVGLTVGFSIIGSIGTAVAGLFLKGSALAFFVRQITLYTLHDTTAMLLAVHHSLVQAAENAGIPKQTLRPKEQFHGGRRDRLV